MWDMIWYLGFPMFAVGVFGAPNPKNKYYDSDANDLYNSENFDVVYDQRQNGTENYKLTVDGLSLVWSPNSLLAAAALLEPALYGEYPGTTVEELFGPEPAEPQKPILQENVNKTTENPPNKVTENNSAENAETPSSPTVLVIEGAHTSSASKPEIKQNLTSNIATKRKLRLPGLLRPFLKKPTTLPEKLSRHN